MGKVLYGTWGVTNQWVVIFKGALLSGSIVHFIGGLFITKLKSQTKISI